METIKTVKPCGATIACMYKTLSGMQTLARSVGKVELLEDLGAHLQLHLPTMAKDVREKGTRSHIEFMETIKTVKPCGATIACMYKTLSGMETSLRSVGEVELLEDLEARMHLHLPTMAKDVCKKGTQRHIEFMETIKAAKPCGATMKSMHKTLSGMETLARSVGEVELMGELEKAMGGATLKKACAVDGKDQDKLHKFVKTLTLSKLSGPDAEYMAEALAAKPTQERSMGERELLHRLMEIQDMSRKLPSISATVTGAEDNHEETVKFAKTLKDMRKWSQFAHRCLREALSTKSAADYSFGDKMLMDMLNDCVNSYSHRKRKTLDSAP
jgi:hypothetical protein